MASDATKSYIFQQLFSIKILTKLLYWVYVYIFFPNFLKYCSNAQKAVFAEVGAVHPYHICKKNEEIRSFTRKILENPFFQRSNIKN